MPEAFGLRSENLVILTELDANFQRLATLNPHFEAGLTDISRLTMSCPLSDAGNEGVLSYTAQVQRFANEDDTVAGYEYTITEEIRETSLRAPDFAIKAAEKATLAAPEDFGMVAAQLTDVLEVLSGPCLAYRAITYRINTHTMTIAKLTSSTYHWTNNGKLGEDMVVLSFSIDPEEDILSITSGRNQMKPVDLDVSLQLSNAGPTRLKIAQVYLDGARSLLDRSGLLRCLGI